MESKKICVVKKKYLIALNIQNCKCRNVYLSLGAEFHILKRHPYDYENYFDKIAEIITEPDYIGKNPDTPNSIETVKIFDDVVLVSITINKGGFLYISSMYSIGVHQLNSRIRNGRLIPAP